MDEVDWYVVKFSTDNFYRIVMACTLNLLDLVYYAFTSYIKSRPDRGGIFVIKYE